LWKCCLKVKIKKWKIKIERNVFLLHVAIIVDIFVNVFFLLCLVTLTEVIDTCPQYNKNKITKHAD